MSITASRCSVQALTLHTPSTGAVASVASLRSVPSIKLSLSSPVGDQRFGQALMSLEFDVYALTRGSANPLKDVTMAVLSHLGALSCRLVSRAALERFLESLAAAYKSNPYHNEHHASDVVQSLGMQLAAYAAERAAAGAEPMGEVEVLTAVLAAAAHDVAHPGVNNDFHQRAGTELAQEFGAAGSCINEAMHAKVGLRLAEEAGVFANFTPEMEQQARALFERMILATDMAHHHQLLARFAAAAEAYPDAAHWAQDKRQLLLELALHAADLSNPARPFTLAAAFGVGVARENLAQGAAEAAAKLAVSKACDAARIDLPACQIFFITAFAKPVVETVAVFAPSFGSEALAAMEGALVRWEHVKQAGIRLPGEPLPEFSDDMLARAAAASAAAAGQQAALAAERSARARAWREARRAAEADANG